MRAAGGSTKPAPDDVPGMVRRGARPARASTVVGLGLALLATAAACSNDGGGTVTPIASALPPDSSPAPRHSVDGRLVIGLWVPSTGSAAVLGRPLQNGAELAVKQINAAGGVNGQPIDLVVVDEGSDPATASEALEELLDRRNVDAIIGPASSRVALAALDRLAEAQVVTCSPTAAALELDTRLDGGYFVRTIGSETLEASALAQAMIGTGNSSFAVLYPDDDYGLAFSDRIRRAFSRRRADVSTVPYKPTDEQFNIPAGQALQGGTQVVGVVGTGELGAKVLAALARNGAPPELVPTFVTDGLRTNQLGALIDARRPMSSAGIQGVSPVAGSRSADFDAAYMREYPESPIAYAAYAYDCANLIALAVQAAASDEPEAMRSQLGAISADGSNCEGFMACADQLAEGRSIDLDGASGALELTPTGDVGSAIYDVFGFDDQGQDVSQFTVTVRDEGG